MTRIILPALLCLFTAAAPCSRAGVVINEFLAENDGGLHDQDGATPDWLELFNNSLGSVNLSGWHLTDNATNLTKWTFPATNMPAGSFLIVFASGKDRATNGAELHSNFQLDNNGGYLALVDSNGVVVSEFNYPQQHRNVSFGAGSSNSPPMILLSNSASAQWLVPTDGSLGTAWTAPGFDASTWSNAVSPLRYDVATGGSAGPPVLSIDVNARSGDSAANTQTGFSSFTIGGSGAQNGAITRTYGAYSVTLSNSSPSFTYDDRLRTSPSNGGLFTLQNIFRDFVFSLDKSSTSGLDVYVAGLSAGETYEFTIWSFDTSSGGNRVSDWFANGVIATNDYAFDGRVLPVDDTRDRITIRAVANPSGGVLIAGRRDTASVGTGGAADYAVFFNGLQIAPVSALPSTNGNLALMAGANSSVFIRQSFSVANPASLNQLTLRVKYNDGFVAYLNGTEISRRNAPATTDWNSAATAVHSSGSSEDILLPGAESLLVAGTNVLAVQGLNVSSSDANFYIEPQLIGVTSASSSNRYFSPATPGSPNDFGYVGVVADTKFSVERGFFDAPFSLSITCATPGTTVYFTTNGSEPSPANGVAFSSPLNITGHSFIRAAAFLSGWVPSGVDTHSYIYLRDVLRQSNNIPGYPTIWQGSYPADYAMDSNIVNHPVYGSTISNDLRSIDTLAIVADQNGLWNASTGIYPNATSIGPAWERAASLELIRGNDGRTEFATTAKIQMHGNASRDNARTPKHSIGVSFSGDYGPTKLHYDWFGGGVTDHDGIVLRSCGFVDGWAGRYADNNLYTSTETGETFRGQRYRPENTCYLRDAWVKDSFRDMGWTASRSAFVHLYINGLYWGLYEPSEHVDASYFASHLGGDDGAWDVVVGEDNNGPPVLVDGSLTDWNNVLTIVNGGITSETAYQGIQQLVDLDNLIDYMLLHIFAESEDWPRHNWYVAHRKATNGIPGTKFICSVWDQELTLDRLVRRDRTNVGGTGGEVYSPARVYQQLRNWPEFRVRFGDRVQKHLFNGGALTPSNNVARFLASASIISNAVVGESARWGDARKTSLGGSTGTGQTFTRNEWWQPEIDKTTTNFFQHLTADNIVRLRAANLYPQLGAPEFNQFGGNVTNGFALAIMHSNAIGVIYFTTNGSDPRAYGSGAVSANAQAYSAPVSITTPTLVRARVFDGANWSAIVEALFNPPQDLSKLALTEIMYHPPDVGLTNGDEFEFIELKNTGTNTLNLLGLTFADGISFTWSNAALVAPGQFVVLVRNAAAFFTKYPGVAIAGQYSGSLANGGERITLAYTFGGNVFSVAFDDLAPWPVAADGYGFSLVQKGPALTQAPDDGYKWRASTLMGGSPGADDPEPTIAPIVINEILTHTVLPEVDRIELFNPTATNVDIGGWFLTDTAALPTRYRIPDGTVIPAGGFLAFDESQFGSSFTLSSAGEDVYVFSGDANTNLTGWSHGFAFGAAASGESFGRYINSVGEEQFPAQVVNTFGSANAGPRVGPVVINEIHYHPAPGGDAFVELKNISATNVTLFDPAHATNTWDLNGLAFTFPPNLTLSPGGLLVIAATNPAAFAAKYSVPASAMVVGPFTGTLQKGGEQLEARRPETPTTNGTPYVVVDAVRYNDRAPWPAAADGSGPSLQRVAASQYGNDPINWRAAAPTPGRENAEPDTDGDGIPDSWEIATGTDPNLPDANNDDDGDGFTNLQEYFAGTDPKDAQSYLRVLSIQSAASSVSFQFLAASNRTYTVQFRDSLTTGDWLLLTNITASPVVRTLSVVEAATNSARFYRLSAP